MTRLGRSTSCDEISAFVMAPTLDLRLAKPHKIRSDFR